MPNLAQPPDFCAQILAALSHQEEVANQLFAALESCLGEVAAQVTSLARPSPEVLPSPPPSPPVSVQLVSWAASVSVGPAWDY